MKITRFHTFLAQQKHPSRAERLLLPFGDSINFSSPKAAKTLIGPNDFPMIGTVHGDFGGMVFHALPKGSP